MPGRQYNAGNYRYGFQGQEQDDEIKGNGNSVNYKYRMHDPRLGRFLSIDPLTALYPHNSPYAFSENRVIDGVELEGLEYISFHHYFNGAVAKTEFYKMDDLQIKRLAGTTVGTHNSVSYGPGGKGIVHYYYNEAGEITDTYWEQHQIDWQTDIMYHGLFSGPGSITNDGYENSTNYAFDQQPIDWADAIAKRHDMDYAEVASENYAGFLEDVRTLQVDRDMVARVDQYIMDLILYPTFLLAYNTISVQGVDTPVNTNFSTEMYGSAIGQRAMINALATYKQWKIDNKLGNDDLYDINREAFSKAYPKTALILDQIP